MKSLPTLLFIGILGCAAACALIPKPITLAPVGPDPHAGLKRSATGYLIVYSAVKTYSYDRQAYLQHTAYEIDGPDGQRYKSVQNATTFHSDNPVEVSLPPAVYEIVAWADGFELVRVPVVINAGRVTEVNLEAHRRLDLPGAAETNLVRMADGRIVGWSAK